MNMYEFNSYFDPTKNYSETAKKAALDKMLGKYAHQLSLAEWETVLSHADKLKYRETDAQEKVTARVKKGGNGDMKGEMKEKFDKFKKSGIGKGILGCFDPKYA